MKCVLSVPVMARVHVIAVEIFVCRLLFITGIHFMLHISGVVRVSELQRTDGRVCRPRSRGRELHIETDELKAGSRVQTSAEGECDGWLETVAAIVQVVGRFEFGLPPPS